MKIGLRHALVAGLLGAFVTVVGPGAAPAASATARTDTDYGRMILLLDSSGSMAQPAGGGQSKIAAAKSALREVVGSLPDEAQVGLRVFGAKVFSRTDKGACTDSQLVVPPGTDNRDELTSAVAGYEPYGETPIPYALQQAAQDLGKEGARSIVLVSDGESTCDPDPCQVAGELAKSGIDLQIDVVGLSVTGAARDQLKCIAEQGNGHYYDADSAGDIQSRLSRVAERAVRPFTLTGEPITGGSEADPTPVTVGDWTDTIGARSASLSYVFERETAGSTIRASAVSQGERAYSDGLQVTINAPDGTRCGYHLNNRTFDARDLIGAEATAGPPVDGSTGDACSEPGAFVITVGRSLAARNAVPFGLRVSEEPPIEEVGYDASTTGGIDVTAPQVSGDAQHVEGGASFANATELAAGRWSSTVVPGEAVLYRVPLDFGQSLRVSLDFPKAKGGVAEAFGRFPPLAKMALFDPMQAEIGVPTGATTSAQPDGSTLTTATAPVSRTPVDLPTKLGGGGDYTTAGDYYVMVSVQRKDYTVELPFTINVEVVGDPQQGPTYAGGATWSVAAGASGGEAAPSDEASAEPSDEPSTADTPAAEAEEDDSSSTAVVAAGVGVLAVLVIGGAVLVWRRRQSG